MALLTCHLITAARILLLAVVFIAFGCSSDLLPADAFAPADVDLTDVPSDVADGPDADATLDGLAGDATVTSDGEGADGDVMIGDDTLDGGDTDLPTDATTVDAGPQCETPADCTISQGPAGSCLLWLCLQQSCKLAVASAGADCADGDPCVEHSCDGAGGCVAGKAKVCPGGSCLVGLCDPSSGGCVQLAATTGTKCDDGNACTTGETCQQDGCTGGVAKDCPAAACQLAGCNAETGACTTTPVQDGEACEDGNLCTQGEACSGGTCSGGSAVTCTQAPCLEAACDTTTGTCVSKAAQDGFTCDDGQSCTSGDGCVAGVCKGGTWTCDCKTEQDCNDNNPCTKDTCTAGTCTFEPLSGSSCDDGDACTSTDVCSAIGICAGTAKTCADGNACTTDGCDSKSGNCTFQPIGAAACDDGDPCTTGETCSSGSCSGGVAKSCPDSGLCLLGSCDTTSGDCKTTVKSGPCNDGDGCSTGKTCSSAGCSGGEAKSCDDGNPCTTDSCNPTTGTCVHTPMADGQSCGTHRVCASSVCTCVLGKGKVPENGWETFYGVAPAGDGYVAVGESSGSLLKRGFFVRFSASNQPTLIRRHGDIDPSKGGAMTFHAVVPVQDGYRVATSRLLLGGQVASLDDKGNLGPWMGSDGIGDARDLVPMPDGVVHIGYNGYSAGADGVVVRYGTSGAAKWKATLSEKEHAVQAWGGVLQGQTIYVVGHQRKYDEEQRRAFLASITEQGKVSWRKTLNGEKDYSLAYAVAPGPGNALWIVGQRNGGKSAQAMLLGFDIAGSKVSSQFLTSAAWRYYGVVNVEKHGISAGIGDFGSSGDDGVWARSDGNKSTWLNHSGGGPDDGLNDVTALPDGTFVAVGGLRDGSKHYGWWVRFDADGKTQCGN